MLSSNTSRSFMTNAPTFDGNRLGVHDAISASFARRDPAGAFLYQQLNTFHTPPMGAVGRALTGGHVEHAALDALGIPMLVITGTDDALVPRAVYH